MQIRDVYNHYPVPPNLCAHMLRVAAVVDKITKHWQGPRINSHEVVLAALLHDIGNLAKFDFESQKVKIPNASFWRQKQKELWQKYGKDDHQVTEKILNELKVKLCIKQWIQDKTFANIIDLVKSQNKWETKILLYADLRTLPNGIGSLEARIDDIKNRMPHYYTRPDFDLMVKSAFQLEDQIQKNIDIQLKRITINDQEFNSFLRWLI